MGDNKIKSDKSSCCANQGRKGISKWLPRTETLILLLGLGCTIWGKMTMLQRHGSDALFIELAQVALSDIVFFASILLFIHLLYLIKPSAWMARAALLLSTLVAMWSVVDVGWLLKCGVQIQPGVLLLLIEDFEDLWPLVANNLRAYSRLAFWLIVMIALVCCGFLWFLWRPGKVIKARIYYIRRIIVLSSAIIVLLVIGRVSLRHTDSNFTKEILSSSSHSYALSSMVSGRGKHHVIAERNRQIPRAGQRQIVAPQYSREELPNVVLVVMESISQKVFDEAGAEAMPALSRLAAEGAQFRLMRIPVVRSTKASWAILTGSMPVIRDDYVEAVILDKRYESLATILANIGYRSGQFQMARGSCESAPSLYFNLGFEWAWFRENFGDPSAYLDGFAGDDCLMIKPALDWALEESKPFVLMLVTSVAHGPGEYNLPAGFGRPREKPYDKYIETVRYTDYFLSELCSSLKENGLNKNTLICILGDHGGSFRKGADNERWIPYEEVLRIPWILHWPGHVEAGQVIDWPCSQLDVTPTILTLMGFDISEARFDGKDAFSPLPADRRLYFSAWHRNSPMGYIEGSRKVVYWPRLNKVFEYDLNHDPGEEKPITVTGKRAEEIKRAIFKWQDASEVWMDPKWYTERLLYDHWQTYSTYRSAWTHYVP